MSDRQEKAFEAWKAVQDIRAETTKNARIDWASMTDELRDPKNISVELGPALTEEQFKQYCKQNGIGAPKIVKSKK